MKIGKISSNISRSVSVLLVIFFIMPWVTISCSGGWFTRCEGSVASGLELAINQEQGNGIYFIILAVALIVLLASFMPLRIARIFYFASAIVGLIFMIYVYFQNGMAQVQIGWWLSLIALFVILASSYFTKHDEAKNEAKVREILERNKQKSSPRS